MYSGCCLLWPIGDLDTRGAASMSDIRRKLDELKAAQRLPASESTQSSKSEAESLDAESGTEEMTDTEEEETDTEVESEMEDEEEEAGDAAS